jgi:hypothetical protein
MSGEPDSVLSMRYHRAATTRETLAALLISERTLRDDPMRSTIFPPHLPRAEEKTTPPVIALIRIEAPPMSVPVRRRFAHSKH